MCFDFKRFASGAWKRSFNPFLPALFLVILPSAALAETAVDSTTILRVQQDTHAGLETKTLMPLTEFLTVDSNKLGDGNLSLHISGWGRLDLADTTPTVDDANSRAAGSLTYGYLQYRFKSANAQAKAGRFTVMDGIVNENVDGVMARSDLPYGFGISAFGGATVHSAHIPGTNTDGKGDALFGGRAYYRKGGVLEIGLSGVYETDAPTVDSILVLPGSFGNYRRVGADVWLHPFDMVQISGHTSFNAETGRVAEHSYLIQVMPRKVKDLVLSGTFEAHHDRDYFYSSLLFSQMLRNLNQQSRSFGASATYSVTKKIDATLDFKHYSRDHYAGDTSTSTAERFGGDLRGNFLNNDLRAGLGYHYLRASSDFAIVPVLGASGSYHETRGWIMHDTKSYFASADLIGYFFKKPVAGKDSAWEGSGSLGYHLTPNLAVSGDLSYGQNPEYNDEFKGLIRLSYNTTFGKGGK
jgi:hypothetical protein